MKLKSAFGYAAVILSLVAVISGILGYSFRIPRDFAESRVTGEMLGEIARYLQANGLTPELTQLMNEVDKHELWLATVVAVKEPDGNQLYPFGDKIAAATDPLLVGFTLADVYPRVSYGLGKYERIDNAAITIKLPDGSMCTVAAFGKQNWGRTYLARTVFVASVFGAWFTIAAWVVTDVKERQVASLTGWTLLAVLTGPVALGVWLTARPSYRARYCPGCGSQIAPGSAYCTRCGHPIVATCPRCGRSVDVEWGYCGNCGTALREEHSNLGLG